MGGRPGQFRLTTIEVKFYLMLPNDKNQWMESNLQVLVSWFSMSLREANQYVWEFWDLNQCELLKLTPQNKVDRWLSNVEKLMAVPRANTVFVDEASCKAWWLDRIDRP